jgi:hypothetical protein
MTAFRKFVFYLSLTFLRKLFWLEALAFLHGFLRGWQPGGQASLNVEERHG